MRPYLFALLISFKVFAQIDTGSGVDGHCTHLTIDNDRIYECETLVISGTPTFTGTNPVIIKVRGDVQVNVAFNLDGQNGGNDLDVNSVIDLPGGEGGPGATDGGGVSTFTAQPGGDQPMPTNAFGVQGQSGACGSGGGGAGFALAGVDGANCTFLGGSGGSQAFTTLPVSIIGGLGGGAGGDGLGTHIGAGGGGGGSLHIMAGGDVIINGNITARGGDGGQSATDSGGGGGGSGGIIWIQSLGNITNNGSINADGGSSGASGSGGAGGTGSRGFVQFEDKDGILDGTGSIPTYGAISPTGTPAVQKLNSSISCGMVKSNERDHHFLLQMVIGFLLSLITFEVLRSKIFTNSKHQA